MNKLNKPNKQCGFVAIVGRPNVGKSTLLNALIGKKLVITSNKPQTTRQRLLGIETQDNVQRIYVDTPGMHLKASNLMNKAMNKAASGSLSEVDVVLWLLIAGQWTKEDAAVLKKIKGCQCPIIVVVNQIDRMPDKTALLPYLESIADKCGLDCYMPISAQTKEGLDQLRAKIDSLLPSTEVFLFPEEQETNQSQTFMMAELIREKLFRLLGDELPYGLAVQIEYTKQEQKILRVHAVIWVEKANHKPMVIGDKGKMLKQVGTQARLEIERMLGQKLFLELWVKVKGQWSDDKQALKHLGYDEL